MPDRKKLGLHTEQTVALVQVLQLVPQAVQELVVPPSTLKNSSLQVVHWLAPVQTLQPVVQAVQVAAVAPTAGTK